MQWIGGETTKPSFLSDSLQNQKPSRNKKKTNPKTHPKNKKVVTPWGMRGGEGVGWTNLNPSGSLSQALHMGAQLQS